MKNFLLVSLICLCLSVFVQGQTDKFVTYSILDWVPSLTTTPAVGYTLGQVGYNWPIRFPVNTGTVKNIKAWLWDGSNDFKIQVFLKRFDIITETEEDVSTGELNSKITSKAKHRICPECGSKTQIEEGCVSCKACGWALCK